MRSVKRQESKGHAETIGRFEYFFRDGELYRAPADCPLDIWGYRQGARFECYEHMAEMALQLARSAGRS